MPPLTLKRLRAIEAALVYRLNNPINQVAGMPTAEDYKFAHFWAQGEIKKRKDRKNEKA